MDRPAPVSGRSKTCYFSFLADPIAIDWQVQGPLLWASSSLLRESRLSVREKAPFLAGRQPAGTKQGALQPPAGGQAYRGSSKTAMVANGRENCNCTVITPSEFRGCILARTKGVHCNPEAGTKNEMGVWQGAAGVGTPGAKAEMFSLKCAFGNTSTGLRQYFDSTSTILRQAQYDIAQYDNLWV